MLSMTGFLIAGIYIASDGYLSMNSWEPVFWMTCVAALLHMLRGGSQRSAWIVFGLSAGIGLLNKPSMTFFLVALGVGLLCTPQRRLLFTRWAALGIAILILIALPNVVWQVRHGWPTLEFLHNGAAEHKNVVLNPAQFLLAQIVQMNPFNMLLWAAGLVALLRGRSVRQARWMGLAYIAFFAITLLLHAKDYYLAPIYPALLAAGAVAWEHRFDSATAARTRAEPGCCRRSRSGSSCRAPWLCRLPHPSLLRRPLPATPWRCTSSLSRTERNETSILPQFYADRFGWESYAEQVVQVYRSLPAEDRRNVCLLTENYGEAGTLDFLGRRLEPALPGRHQRA